MYGRTHIELSEDGYSEFIMHLKRLTITKIWSVYLMIVVEDVRVGDMATLKHKLP